VNTLEFKKSGIRASQGGSFLPPTVLARSIALLVEAKRTEYIAWCGVFCVIEWLVKVPRMSLLAANHERDQPWDDFSSEDNFPRRLHVCIPCL